MVKAKRIPSRILELVCTIILLSVASFPTAKGQDAPPDKTLPTLFIIGDSTVRNNTKGQVGWGDPIAKLFDGTKVTVRNRALGGRSSRSYQTEGLWDKVLADMRTGDFVLMQFGHNDGGPLDSGRARASLKGNGEETREVVDAKTGKKEVVHTFGWYMRKYVADTKNKGATAVVLSPIPRNIWKDAKVARAANDYGKWAAEAARAEGVDFIDLNEIVAKQYEQLGPEKVAAMFEGDHTHTNLAGAKLNAEAVVSGLRELKNAAPWHRLLLVTGDEKDKSKDSLADFIDPATGHRVIRMSTNPGTGSFYFHQSSYTEKGDKLVVENKAGYFTIDLTTLGVSPPKNEQITQTTGGSPILGKKTRQLFYYKGGSIYATHIDTKVTREIAKLPPGYTGASGLAINADETLLASTGRDPEAKSKAKVDPDSKKDDLFPPLKGPPGKMTPGGKSLALFTVNIATGEIRPIHYSTDWLNHTQFSPTDPGLILFCHEGTWDNVNRVWTIRTDGTGLKLMHQRTMKYEIAGHEFFSSDGKMVWYDLQTPRSTLFWLAGVNIETGARIRYQLDRSWWSVHYNQSHDGKLFSGDGGGPNSVANRPPKGADGPLAGPGNGQWIYLFTPKGEKFETLKVGAEEVKVGKFEAEKLVNLAKHDYKLEPNGTFTPDDRWIVFRSNMQGPKHVYAVEIKKAK